MQSGIRRTVAVYGGSFNPPHVGHAMVAAWLGWTEQADEVWLLPTFAHAFGKALLDFDTRVAMCEALATSVGPWVGVCTIERTLPTPSYTIDTLNALSATHADTRFRLVIGADILPDTPRWKHWERIERDFTPIVVGRGGYPPIEGMPTFPTVSSTAIRQRMLDGKDPGGLLPRSVAAILERADRSAWLSP